MSDSKMVPLEATRTMIMVANENLDDYALPDKLMAKVYQWMLKAAPAIWRLCAEELPREHEVVLTHHEDDCYPVAAFYMTDNFFPDGTWLREIEGPEDTYDGRNGRHEKLYRPPTHWMPLPSGPHP